MTPFDAQKCRRLVSAQAASAWRLCGSARPPNVERVSLNLMGEIRPAGEDRLFDARKQTPDSVILCYVSANAK